ncbi:MAG: MBL fold metallo-hydrolase [Anaerolineales bacterium]
MPTPFTELTSQLWVHQSQLFYTNSGIFASDGEACLIDPGIEPEAIWALGEFLDRHHLHPVALILTHAHWDHILGPERFPGVTVVAQVNYLDVLQERSDDLGNQIARWEEASGLTREQPFTPPLPDITFEEETTLSVGESSLRLLHAPGHTPDQCVVYHAASGLLWAADMLSDLEIPFVSGDLAAYEKTLQRLATLEIRALVPGHGHPTRERTEIRQRLEEDQGYLAALRSCVVEGVRSGRSLEETLALCDHIPLRYPEDNALPHERNVKSAYAHVAGKAAQGEGWEEEWEGA